MEAEEYFVLNVKVEKHFKEGAAHYAISFKEIMLKKEWD